MPELSSSSAPNSARLRLSPEALTYSSFIKSPTSANSMKLVVLSSATRIACESRIEATSQSKAYKGALSPGMAERGVRHLLLILFVVVMGLGIIRADEKKPTDTAAGDAGTTTAPYQVKVLSPGMVEIGKPLLIGVFGSFAEELSKSGLDSDPETARKNLKLYIDGVAMEGLLAVILPPEAAVGLKTTDPKPACVLQFVLGRDSNNEPNRKAWDSLLSQLEFGPQRLQVGVGLNGKVPHLTPDQDLQFQVRDVYWIGSVICVGLVLLVLGLLAVICSGMARESGPGTPYSLGKTQMAFWGLMVAICFLAVWLIGHRMERIPPQVLILMGISGVTGLGSVLINTKPKQPAQPAQLVEAGQPPQAAQQVQAPQQAHGAQPAKPHPLQWFLETMSRWFSDIISDGTGVSFQRLQVVIWTVILGFVFAWTVANTCSMPEFDNTLLVLMGISNGLYLGFKIPETPK
jgi:hypothetical protein